MYRTYKRSTVFSAGFQDGLWKWRIQQVLFGVGVLSIIPPCLLGTWAHVGYAVAGLLLYRRLLRLLIWRC